MVTAGGALRTKVFTATWPSFAADASAYDGGARVGRTGGAGKQHNAPRCQVEIRAVSTDSTEDAFVSGGASSGWLQGGGFPEDQGALGDGGSDDNVVFLDPSLHLRRYNSVSLAEDGVYRITLSDCHGFVVAPPVASAAVGSGAKHPNGGGERGVKTARLLFFSLPPYLDFEVDSQVSGGGGLEIGTFQLVPVAYIPPPPLPSPPSSPPPPPPLPPPPPPRQALDVPPPLSLDMAGYASGDAGVTSTPPSASPSSHTTSMGALQSRAGEDDGRASFSGCFVSGVVVGAVAIASAAWLVAVRGRGGSTRERFLRGRREDGRRKEGNILVTEADDGGGSDDGSSDSDAIPRGHVLDPVGLPRSEEDWRALFDTLYEDEKD